jgi:hypothetical protein
MQENTEEQGLVREDNVSSISHAEVCSSLQSSLVPAFSPSFLLRKKIVL